jgi:hypothetical protein
MAVAKCLVLKQKNERGKKFLLREATAGEPRSMHKGRRKSIALQSSSAASLTE